jgi:hypothetical protein
MSGISSRQGSHQVAHTFTNTARAPGLRMAACTVSSLAGTIFGAAWALEQMLRASRA